MQQIKSSTLCNLFVIENFQYSKSHKFEMAFLFRSWIYSRDVRKKVEKRSPLSTSAAIFKSWIFTDACSYRAKRNSSCSPFNEVRLINSVQIFLSIIFSYSCNCFENETNLLRLLIAFFLQIQAKNLSFKVAYIHLEYLTE